MISVQVHVIDMGAAADTGAARYNLPDDRSVIVVHAGLPVDEQSALITELTRPGELPVIVNDPQDAATDRRRRRQSGAATRLRVASAAASVAAVAAYSTQLAGG